MQYPIVEKWEKICFSQNRLLRNSLRFDYISPLLFLG